VSRLYNQTCEHVCIRSCRVLTTCRAKWYVPNQVHWMLLGVLLVYVPYHRPGQVGTNKVSRVLLCLNLLLLSSSEITQPFPSKSCVVATGQAWWLSLSEFPVCYSNSISISLCISCSRSSSCFLASPRDEAKGGECSDPGPQARHICIY
jgi:hypothetical protein